MDNLIFLLKDNTRELLELKEFFINLLKELNERESKISAE